MKITFIIFLLIQLLSPTLSYSSDIIYVADLEKIVININEYEPINQRLLEYKQELKQREKLQKDKLNDLTNQMNISLKLLNQMGKSKKMDNIKQARLSLYNIKQENKNLLLEKEQSLKFPLIKKILIFINIQYQEKKEIPFIIDKESLVYYKRDNAKIKDLTNEIISKINKLGLLKSVAIPKDQ